MVCTGCIEHFSLDNDAGKCYPENDATCAEDEYKGSITILEVAITVCAKCPENCKSCSLNNDSNLLTCVCIDGFEFKGKINRNSHYLRHFLYP
jgi:hypothetical protein